MITLMLARRPPDGGFVPLDEQDPADWDAQLIAEGEAYLRRAHPDGPPGRFQLEAAIQAVHCDRRRTGTTDWAALSTLYAALLMVAPSLGARVAAAVVRAKLDGPEAGSAALPADAESFQPYWAAKAALLAQAGRDPHDAYRRAVDLTDDPSVAAYLRDRALLGE